MKKLWLLAAIAALIYVVNRQAADVPARHSDSATSTTQPRSVSPGLATDAITEAFRSQQSGIEVTGAGIVSRILGDDQEGDRHQRFILTLDSGQTLLVAHNIDVAPRIDSLAVGDEISFQGVYEWNEKGGVLHWTHHDPHGQHEAGWVRHRGRTYQ